MNNLCPKHGLLLDPTIGPGKCCRAADGVLFVRDDYNRHDEAFEMKTCSDPGCIFPVMEGLDVCALHPKSGALPPSFYHNADKKSSGIAHDDIKRAVDYYDKLSEPIFFEWRTEACREILRKQGFVVIRCSTTSKRLWHDLRRSLRFFPLSIPGHNFDFTFGPSWDDWRGIYGSNPGGKD